MVGTFPNAGWPGGMLDGSVAITYPCSSISASARPAALRSSTRTRSRSFCFSVEG